MSVIVEKCPCCGGDAVNRSFFWEAVIENGDEVSLQIFNIQKSIKKYYLALDRRDNGTVAQDRAFAEIQSALNMHWKQGEVLRLIESNRWLKKIYDEKDENMSNTQVAIDAVNQLFKDAQRIAELEKAINQLVPLINEDKDGEFFICSEGRDVVRFARDVVNNSDGRLAERYSCANRLPPDDAVIPAKAAPADMRKALEIVGHLKRAGIFFIPVPVLNDVHRSSLFTELTDNLELLEQAAHQESE